MLDLNNVYHGDCLTLMKSIDDKSIDMILCDLPYGTSKCKWDTIIPFDLLWDHYKRVIKDNGAIVLTASQPFTSNLIMSNLGMFKYCWVWEKSNPANIAQANRQPLKYHEDVCVFYSKQPTYNKKMIERSENGKKRIISHQKSGVPFKMSATEHQGLGKPTVEYGPDRYDANLKNPSTVLKFKVDRGKLHPTQKPVALFQYFVETYTNEGDTVLDNCAGSGTTGIACINANRNFILMELDEKYCDTSNKRIKQRYEEIKEAQEIKETQE